MGEAAKKMEGYAVSEACIACDACCNDFSEVFKMNADHTRAIAYAEVEAGQFDPWDIIYDCPVDAISLIKGELPPPPAGKKPKSTKEEKLPVPEVVDTRPWEVRWAEAEKRGSEPYWERMKRYGQAYSVEETPSQYHFRFSLPTFVPEHPLKYKMNLPNKMPDYKFDIQMTDGGTGLKLKAWLEDASLKRFSGMINSFPDRFQREIDLSSPAKEFKHNYNPQEKVLDIIVDKT
ncbi:MAG: ferredoxin [Deltaproteobacteria bacterium]|nr:ferredoxin [Deltaproteobacteria bacterium]